MKVVIEESVGVGVTPFVSARREFEAAYCGVLLTRTRGNVTQAARLAKKDRKDFYCLMQRAGVNVEEFRR
jgi:two-component system response regulator GlrR